MATTKKVEEVKATETVKTEKVAEVKAEAKKAPEAKKPAAKKPAAKKAPAKKAAAKKPAAKKPAAKKAPAKKVEAKKTVYVEISGNQFAAKSVVDNCVKAYKAANKGATVKSVDVYINADENKAYYVVNGEPAGFIEL